MQKFFSLLRIGWLDAVTYSGDFLLSVFSWSIRLFISIFLWLSVTRANGGAIGEYTYHSIMTYFFIIQILSGFVHSRVGFEMVRDIHRGEFANFLVKPMNYIVFRLAVDFARNSFRTLVSIVVFGLFIAFFFEGVSFSWFKVVATLVVVLSSYLINISFICMIALSSFWIVNSNRIMFMYFGLLTILSGTLVPLDLFPKNIAPTILALPFAHIFYLPAKIIQSSEISGALLYQIGIGWVYVAVLLSIVAFIYSRGLRRFEAVGG